MSASKETLVLALRRSRACRCKTRHVICDRRAQSRWLLVSMYQEARRYSQVELRASRSLNASCFRVSTKTTVRESRGVLYPVSEEKTDNLSVVNNYCNIWMKLIDDRIKLWETNSISFKRNVIALNAFHDTINIINCEGKCICAKGIF